MDLSRVFLLRALGKRLLRLCIAVAVFLVVSGTLHAAEPASDAGLLGGRSALERGLGWFFIWVLLSIASAKLLDLVWSLVLLPIARCARTTRGVRLLEATRRPAQLVAFLTGLRLGAELTYGNIPEVAGHAGWPICTGVLYVGLVLAITVLLFAATKALLDWYGTEKRPQP